MKKFFCRASVDDLSDQSLDVNNFRLTMFYDMIESLIRPVIDELYTDFRIFQKSVHFAPTYTGARNTG